MTTAAPTLLRFAAGQLVVDGWPASVPLPHGVERRRDGTVVGPARLRRAARRALQTAGVAFADRAVGVGGAAPPSPPADAPGDVAAAFAAWQGTGAGIATGLPLPARAQLVQWIAAAYAAPTLIVVPDTGAVAAWQRDLLPRLGAVPEVAAAATGGWRAPAGAPPLLLATAAAAAWSIGWLGGRHDVLVVDGLDLVPPARLDAIVDGSAALLRLGLAAMADALLAQSRGLGPLVFAAVAAPGPRTFELRLSLDAAERAAYEAAWHEFFAVFDRFAALRPAAGFGEFVRWARHDAAGRLGLLAWHRAAQTASWTAAKEAALVRLLTRHRGERTLVFAPDCERTYAIAQAHRIAAVTAELPRRERDAALREFAAGARRVLVGPRLLATGLPDGSADVAIAIGTGHGRAERQARWARVHRDGVVYELLSRDTMEVGRAHRQRGHAAAAPAVLVDP